MEKALAKVNCMANVGESKAMMDSHCSFTNGSPKSEVVEPEVEHKHVSKKRKTMPRRREQVEVCLGTEGNKEDGYSWRKYGQKDILGAKFPRGYYRCTYRNIQGCLATKQVQKSDEDPMIYEITYIGRHTCTQASHLKKTAVPPSKTKLRIEENEHQTNEKNQPQQEKIEQPPETIFSFGSQGEVKVEDLDLEIFPSFCFSSPSVGSENEENNNIFPHSMIDNNLLENFSSSFMSTTITSESDMFCNWESIGLGQSVHNSTSDITDIVSTPTSATYSSIMDLDDIFLDKNDFDTDFPMNTRELCI